MSAVEHRYSPDLEARLQRAGATVRMRSEVGMVGSLALRIRFGKRLQVLRLGAQLALCDLAYLLGISHRHLEDIENGSQDVDLLLLEQLAEALKISIAALVQGV